MRATCNGARACRAFCGASAVHAHVHTRARHMINVDTYCVSCSCDVVRRNHVLAHKRTPQNLTSKPAISNTALLVSVKKLHRRTSEHHVHGSTDVTINSFIANSASVLVAKTVRVRHRGRSVIRSVSRGLARLTWTHLTGAIGRARSKRGSGLPAAGRPLLSTTSRRRAASAPRAASSKRPRLSHADGDQSRTRCARPRRKAIVRRRVGYDQ